MMSSEQLQKLAELRKQRANAPQTSNNIVQVCQQALSVKPVQQGSANGLPQCGGGRNDRQLQDRLVHHPRTMLYEGV